MSKTGLVRKIFELMEEKYLCHFEVLPNSTDENVFLFFRCSLSCKEYGHPKYDTYKTNFHSTMVTVAEKEIILFEQITNKKI